MHTGLHLPRGRYSGGSCQSEIVTRVNEDRSIDPELVWATDRQRMNLSSPDKELFVRMFAEHQAANAGQRKAIRERIILESTNLVRKYVAAHVATLNKQLGVSPTWNQLARLPLSRKRIGCLPRRYQLTPIPAPS